MYASNILADFGGSFQREEGVKYAVVFADSQEKTQFPARGPDFEKAGDDRADVSKRCVWMTLRHLDLLVDPILLHVCVDPVGPEVV